MRQETRSLPCTAPHLYGKRYKADQPKLLHHLAQALAELPAQRPPLTQGPYVQVPRWHIRCVYRANTGAAHLAEMVSYIGQR